MTFHYTTKCLDGFQEIENVLDLFRARYREIYPGKACTEFEGKYYDIDSAAFVYYEGVEEIFGVELCNQAIPLIVLKVLSRSFNAEWGVVSREKPVSYAIKHPQIDFYVTVADLIDKTYLPRDFTWDEYELPPTPAEIALKSYETLKELFSYLKHRIGSQK